MAFSLFNKKPSAGSFSSSTSWPLLILLLTFRLAQFALALAVCGLYGKDLNAARKEDKYADSKWVYAVVVGALSTVSAVVYAALLGRDRGWGFGWDGILFILWAAVFGTFGHLYIHEDPEGDSGIKRMKNAVWVDLVNMLLWFLTAVVGVVMVLMRNKRSLHTGRATI